MTDHPQLSGQSFQRNQRLLSAADYQQVFKRAQRSVDKHFMVLARKNNSGSSRLGLAIAKKQVKLAVGRNRIKRVIRESFRHQEDRLNGYDFVVLARKDTYKSNNDKLFHSLEQHWRKLTQPDSKKTV